MRLSGQGYGLASAEAPPLEEEPEPSSQSGPPAEGVPASSMPIVVRESGFLRSSPRDDHIGYGPLRLRSQGPYQALRLGIVPRTPSTLGKGQYDLRTSVTWVNIWASDDVYLLDYEMLETSVAVARGITDTLQVEIELYNRSRFGGALDSISQGVHDLLGISQDGRDDVPRNQFNFLWLPTGDVPGGSLDASDRGSFSRSVQLTVQHELDLGSPRAPAICYAVTGRFETAETDDLGGDGRFDLGASIGLAQRLGATHVYAVLGYARLARDDFRGLALDDTQLTLLAAAEWRLLARQSIVVQYLLSEAPMERYEFGHFTRASHEITLGWKQEFSRRSVVEVGLLENTGFYHNSADFGFHLAFTTRF